MGPARTLREASQAELLRALFHTPSNPFVQQPALKCPSDGGLLIESGRVAACGDYGTLRAAHPEAVITDLRGRFPAPRPDRRARHFPQLRVLGNLGRSLLDGREHCALPEEPRMAGEC